MKKIFPLLFLVVALFWSCTNKSVQKNLDAVTYNRYLEEGKKISAQAQSALLSSVSEAMKQGGTHYAVEFCNLEASEITDSLNTVCNCSISRVSDRNRNPDNALSGALENELWDYYLSINETHMIHDTVVAEGDHAFFYKPILTALQTCLQCHGSAEKIDAVTYKKINELYPGDQATGYSLNELRGLWKIRFELDQ